MSLEPLTFERIEGGRLRDALNEAFEALQSSLIAHCEKWGEKAEGSTAALSLNIKLKVVNPHDCFVSVESSLKPTPPERPKVKTSGIGQHRKSGQPVLFCQTDGSDDGDPRQSRMFSISSDRIVNEGE